MTDNNEVYMPLTVEVLVPRSMFEDELGEQGYRPTEERVESLVHATEEIIRQSKLTPKSEPFNLFDEIEGAMMASLDMLAENGALDDLLESEGPLVEAESVNG